jgi:hypothetical protein
MARKGGQQAQAASLLLVAGFMAMVMFVVLVLMQFAFRPRKEEARENFIVGPDSIAGAERRLQAADETVTEATGVDLDELNRVLGGMKENMAASVCRHPPSVISGDRLTCNEGYSLSEPHEDQFLETDARHGMRCCEFQDTCDGKNMVAGKEGTYLDDDGEEKRCRKTDMTEMAEKVHLAIGITSAVGGDMAAGEILERGIDRLLRKITGDASDDAFYKLSLRCIEYVNVQGQRMMGRATGDALGNSAAKTTLKVTDTLTSFSRMAMGAALLIFDLGSTLLDMWDPFGFNQFTAIEAIRRTRDGLEVAFAANIFSGKLGMKAPYVWPWSWTFSELMGPCYGEMYANCETWLHENKPDYRDALELMGQNATDDFYSILLDIFEDPTNAEEAVDDLGQFDPLAMTEEQITEYQVRADEIIKRSQDEAAEILETFIKMVPPRVRGKFLFQAVCKRLAQGGLLIEDPEGEEGVTAPPNQILRALASPGESDASVIERYALPGETATDTTSRIRAFRFTGFSTINEDGKVTYLSTPKISEETGEPLKDADGGLVYDTEREWKSMADCIMFCEDLLPKDSDYFADLNNQVVFEEIDRCIVLTEKGEQYQMAHMPDSDLYKEDPTFIPVYTKKYRLYDEEETRKGIAQGYMLPGADTTEMMLRNPRQKSHDIPEITAKMPNADNTEVTVDKVNHLTLVSPLSVMYNTCEGKGDRTAGDMFVGFGVGKEDDTYQEFIRGRETINPADYGVTFDKDEGVCRYTRSYCDKFALRYETTEDGLPDCGFYNGQELAEFLFGTTVTRVVMMSALKADRAIVKLGDKYAAACGKMGGGNAGAKGVFSAICGGPIAGVRAGLQAGINVIGSSLMPFEYMGNELMDGVTNTATCFAEAGMHGGEDGTSKGEQSLRCAAQAAMIPYQIVQAGLEGGMDALTSNPVGKPAGEFITKTLGCQTCGDVVSEALGGFMDDVLTSDVKAALANSVQPGLDMTIDGENLFVDGQYLGATADFNIGADGVGGMVGIGGRGGAGVDIDIDSTPSIDIYIADTPVLESIGNGVANFFSDPRCKEDVIPLGKAFGRYQLPLYSWRWSWNPAGSQGRSVGVMAHQVMKVAPHAISHDDQGYLLVDYSLIA